MKRKTVILIGTLALTLSGCSNNATVNSTAETSEITESMEQISEEENSEQAATKEPELEITFPEGGNGQNNLFVQYA